MTRKEKVHQLIVCLCEGLYEREEAVKLTLLSAVAGESIFMLGPPGVGKSLIARRLKFAFKNARSFEYLMTRFSTPEEVFGPVSIQKLKNEDKYERKTEHYMPGANIVFLDEIWKASSSIQNALLTIINEKVYRNGEQEIAVDLKSLITASNELPPQGENFAPLYDRLLIRYQMGGVRGSRDFLKMITGKEDVYRDTVPSEAKLDARELEDWYKQIDAIKVEEEVLSVIQIIRTKIEEYNQKQAEPLRQIQVYDRRWKKIIRLLRTSAFLNERAKVDLMDCFLMVHCLWNEPAQIKVIEEIVSETIRKHGYSVSIGMPALRREVREFAKEVEEEVKVAHLSSEEVLRPVEDEYYALRKNGEDFAGRYLQVKDFNKLSTESEEVLNLYDEQFKLVNRLSAYKPAERHSVNIKHNAQLHLLKLETYQKEKKHYIYKKPHPLVKEYWDERYEKIETYLKEQQEMLREARPEELDSGKGNLFIDHSLYEVVEANHQEVTEELAQLQLQLQKGRHMYESIG